MRRCVIAIVLVSIVTAGSAVGAGRRRAVAHPSGPAAPEAKPDSYSLAQASTLTVAAPGVLANDTLNGAAVIGFGAASGAEQTTVGASTATSRAGTVRLDASGAFVYTPPATFSGSDTFTYVLRNAGGTSAAKVTIEVAPDVVKAITDAYSTAPEEGLFVPAPGVLTNDTLAGGRIVSFGPRTGAEQTSLSTGAPTIQGGVINLHADGSFDYEPPPTVDDGYGYSRAFRGLDAFQYVIQSGTAISSAAVNITVEDRPTGADFVVTTPGHYYAISGLSGENPALQLQRGRTYTFQIAADPSHPFAILDAPPGTVVNNNITSGTITFTVPATAQNYRYRCTTHGFGNVINTTN